MFITINRYIERKRKGKSVNASNYLKLRDKMVEVYFGEERRFKMGQVLDVQAYFEEGGNEMKVKHLVHYIGEKRPAPWEDLTQRKYSILRGDLLAMGAERQKKIDALRAVKEQAERDRLQRIADEEVAEKLEREKEALEDLDFEKNKSIAISDR